MALPIALLLSALSSTEYKDAAACTAACGKHGSCFRNKCARFRPPLRTLRLKRRRALVRATA